MRNSLISIFDRIFNGTKELIAKSQTNIVNNINGRHTRSSQLSRSEKKLCHYSIRAKKTLLLTGTSRCYVWWFAKYSMEIESSRVQRIWKWIITFYNKLVVVAGDYELNAPSPLGVIAAAQIRDGLLASLVHVHVACWIVSTSCYNLTPIPALP